MTDTRADQYAAVWACVYLGTPRDHGWLHNQGEPVCVCGTALTEPAEAA
jgi:hypothetical protein